jgi:hypothetical protein
MYDMDLLEGGLKARLPLQHTGPGHFPVQRILGMNRMSIREAGEPGTGAGFEIPSPRGGFLMGDGCGTHGNARIQA